MPPTPSKSEEEKREPCMAQYKQLNGEAGSWGLKHGSRYMDNCRNSRANTCIQA